MRAEEWNYIRQEIADGTVATPPNYNASQPWKTIIAVSRPFFSQGVRYDWWLERTTVLDRAGNNKNIPTAAL